MEKEKRGLRRSALLLIPLLLLCALSFNTSPGSREGERAAETSGSSELSREERREDAEYLVKVLSENYPLFGVNLRKTGTDWLANREFYIGQMTDAKSDEAFLEAINRTLGDLHDGHTHVVDGWFLDNLDQGYRDVVEYGSWSAELNRESVLRRYPVEGRLLAENAEGNQYYMDETASYDGIVSDYVYPDYDYSLLTRHWPEEGAAYLRLPTFNAPEAAAYESEVRNFLQGLPSETALILDIRGNSGGTVSYWQGRLVPMLADRTLSQRYYLLYRNGEFQKPFMRDLAGYKNADFGDDISGLLALDLPNLPPEARTDYGSYYRMLVYTVPDPDFHLSGRIFLLVDQGVYSAAEMFASFAKDSGLATLIGTTTGGGTGTGPIVCALPHSGYLIRFPQEMAVSADGSPNDEFGTAPDVESDAPYVSGSNPRLDEAVRKALELAHE